MDKQEAPRLLGGGVTRPTPRPQSCGFGSWMESTDLKLSNCLSMVCRWRDLNPHDRYRSGDFKSPVSAISPHRHPLIPNYLRWLKFTKMTPSTRFATVVPHEAG